MPVFPLQFDEQMLLQTDTHTYIEIGDTQRLKQRQAYIVRQRGKTQVHTQTRSNTDTETQTVTGTVRQRQTLKKANRSSQIRFIEKTMYTS